MKTLFLFMLSLLGYGSLQAQADSTLHPYQRFPNNIPLKILLADSTTTYTADNIPKKKGFIVMLFSPDCEHCKQEIKEVKANIDSFKQYHIVMVTPMPFDRMKSFYQEYELDKYPNITVGRDQGFTLPVYYGIRFFPYLAFYNRKHELLSTFEGNVSVADMLTRLRK